MKKKRHFICWENGQLLVFITAQNTTLVRKALRQNAIGVALSQLLRQWRSWRTGSDACALRFSLQ